MTLPAENLDGSRTRPPGRDFPRGKLNGADVTVKDSWPYSDTQSWGSTRTEDTNSRAAARIRMRVLRHGERGQEQCLDLTLSVAGQMKLSASACEKRFCAALLKDLLVIDIDHFRNRLSIEIERQTRKRGTSKNQKRLRHFAS